MSPSECVSGLSPENSPETGGRLSPVSLPYRGETETKSPGENNEQCQCDLCLELNTAANQSADAAAGIVDTGHGSVAGDHGERARNLFSENSTARHGDVGGSFYKSPKTKKTRN